ncbi:tape measure protein [Dysgonomonas sp. Marseille-P4677]|uniref:tape measure protein n=1 Tax=Dysgonomonas sp. Marseille-P4677 TaxID=2364790 RepID=UPI001912C233|nr:tape measure protein [Dysgonomonas sp. Marseille-P4677]MBK5721378.1 tape measure protein [Dysgonomonas sp. Marseille-P4677]
MAGKLSFSIAVNLLTENFKRGTKTIKDSFRSLQMQIITFAAALGAAGFGLTGLVSRMKDVARETGKALTALKNVSGSTGLFADNLRFLNGLSNKYGVEINSLVMAYAKFKAAGDSVNMSIQDQRKIFEATSRAATAYGMSAEDTNLTFLAITQMMSKGKISSEELRRQLGERLPIAMAAMAKAAGVPISKLDDLLKKGKLMSADILPKFADALNEMIPNVDTDNLETSIIRMQNMFTRFTEGVGFREKFKALVDGLTKLIMGASDNIRNIIVGVFAFIAFYITSQLTKVYQAYATTGKQIIASSESANAKMTAATAARVEAEIALDRAKSAAFFATEKQRLQASRAVSKAQTLLKARELAESKAIEAAKLADAQAAAIKTGGFWVTTGAMIRGTFLKIKASALSMWKALWPALLIAALVSLIGYFKNMYDEVKRVKNIFSDFKKEASNAGNTSEIKMLQAQLSIMNDKTRSQKEINEAQAKLNSMLQVEGKNQKELNKLVAERIELIKAAAQADFYAQKNVEVNDQIDKSAREGGLSRDQAMILARLGTKKGTSYNDLYQATYKMVGSMDKADKAMKSIAKIGNEYLQIYDYTNEQLENAIIKSNKKSIDNQKNPDDDKKKSELQKSEEKYIQSLRELDAQLKLNKDTAGLYGLNQQEYNKSLDELIRKTVIDAKGTGNKKLLDSDYLKNLEQMAANPLYNKTQDEIEQSQKKYNENLKELTNSRNAGAITEEEYNTKLQELVNNTIELSGSILGANASTNEFFNSLVALKNSKLQALQNEYNTSIKKLTDQHTAGAISDKEYITSMQDLIDNTVKLAGTLLGADAATNEWYKKLLAAKSSKPEKVDLKFNAEADDIISNSSSYQEAYKKLSESAMKSSKSLLDEIDKMMSNNPNLSLSEAMKLAQAKIEIRNIRKELAGGLYSEIKNGISGIDGMVNSVERLKDVFSNVDASGWERIMAVWNVMTSTIDGLLSVISMIEKMTEVINSLSAAKQAESAIDTATTATKISNTTAGMAADQAAAATKATTATTEVAANTAVAATEAGKSAAKLPFPVNLIAIGAAIAGVIALFSQIPKFANGGIIQGTAIGDMNLARVNGGEMILNGSQQKTLFDLLNGGGTINTVGDGGEVRFTIEGSKLVGVLDNYTRRKNRMS